MQVLRVERKEFNDTYESYTCPLCSMARSYVVVCYSLINIITRNLGDECPNSECHEVFVSEDALRLHILRFHMAKQTVSSALLEKDSELDNATDEDTSISTTATTDRSLCGPHFKCMFCGCCLTTNALFAHMALHCLVRNNPGLANVVADCQKLDTDLHSVDDSLVCTCLPAG